MGVEDCRTWRRFMKLRRTAGNSYLKICWQSNALRRTCSNRHKDCGQFPDIAEVLERIYRDGMKPRKRCAICRRKAIDSFSEAGKL